MSTAALVPVGEYLSSSYDPDVDYVDGELEDRNAGEKDHAKLQRNLLIRLAGLREKLGIEVFPEQRVRVSSTRYRVPDLCVTIGEPDEQVFTTPPFLCVEILSPEDRAGRMQRKIADYLKAGVRYVWVIDPRAKEAFIYTAAGMRASEELRTEDPEILVPLGELL